MGEEARKERMLEAVKLIVAELEKLRMLREYELGAKVNNYEGTLHVEPVERR